MDIPPLVSLQWLRDNLDDLTLGVIENAWDKQLYARGHIPGALATPGHPHLKHFDTDGAKSPHLFTPEEFQAFCEALGLRRERHYVIYDDWHGLFAARFWWVCRYYGFGGISVLDGGWQGWCGLDYPTTTEVTVPAPGSDVHPLPHPEILIEMPELLDLCQRDNVLLWDTRRRAEFCGEERSDNRRQGHIPKAVNFDWTHFLQEAEVPDAGRQLFPLAELRERASAAGLARGKTIIPYCQSGVRAAFGYLVLHLLGYNDLRLYDGSLFEWANAAHTPMTLEERRAS